MLLLLIACEAEVSEPIVCPDARSEGFTPVVEPDPRLDGDEIWEAEDEATVTQAGLDVTVAGVGTAVLRTVVDRGVTHAAQGEITGDAVGRVELRHFDDDRYDVLASQDFAGPTTIALSGTPTRKGDELAIAVVVTAGTSATLSDLTLTGERWAEVASTPSADAPITLGFLIHIEDDAQLLTDVVKWERRARVFEGVSQTLAAHGAMLTLQPDINFVRAAATHDPAWIPARTEEGMSWSIHVHDESDGAEVFEAAIRDARRGYVDLGIDITDMNGGFGLGMWEKIETIGLRSVTAYKDGDTQLGLPSPHVQPWRLAEGASTADVEAFTTHDPEGPLVYLPGDANREPDHTRFGDYARRELSQVFGAARPDTVNTWYFMFHVDGFLPGDDEADAYLDGGQFTADLSEYDAFLSTVTDPLVADGALVYGSPKDMLADWDVWEADCSAASSKAE